MIIGDWLARRAALTPEKTALIDTLDGNRAINYRAWNQSANRIARLLSKLGVGRGDRVAVLAMNSTAYLDVWFACGKLGAIMQPLNWRLTTPELAGLLDDAAPSMVFYGADFVQQARDLRKQAPSVRHYVAMESVRADDDRLLAEPVTPLPAVKLSLTDPWVLCYTGGTTGSPKGAILTHGNVIWNAINTTASWGLAPDDISAWSSQIRCRAQTRGRSTSRIW